MEGVPRPHVAEGQGREDRNKDSSSPQGSLGGSRGAVRGAAGRSGCERKWETRPPEGGGQPTAHRQMEEGGVHLHNGTSQP